MLKQMSDQNIWCKKRQNVLQLRESAAAPGTGAIFVVCLSLPSTLLLLRILVMVVGLWMWWKWGTKNACRSGDKTPCPWHCESSCRCGARASNNMKTDGTEVPSGDTRKEATTRFSCCFREEDDAAAVLLIVVVPIRPWLLLLRKRSTVSVVGGGLICLMIPYRERCFRLLFGCLINTRGNTREESSSAASSILYRNNTQEDNPTWSIHQQSVKRGETRSKTAEEGRATGIETWNE